MTPDIIVGLILTAGALGAIIFLTLWSRRIIDHIHSKSSKKSPNITGETDNDRS